MNEFSTWVTVIATCISAWAAWAMWKVSKRTLVLQHSIEDSKKPLAHIWYNTQGNIDGQKAHSFTFLNIGSSPLPIRSLKAIFSDGTHGRVNAFVVKPEKDIGVKVGRRFDINQQEISDLILIPNELYFIEVVLTHGQFNFKIMYYDNTFENINIDTSNLGGKYILIGHGKK